jgi:hypothetical protein
MGPYIVFRYIYKYIQRHATVSHNIQRDATVSHNIQRHATVSHNIQRHATVSHNLCAVTTKHPGKSYRILHFTIPHSYFIPTATYAVIYSWRWAWWKPETCRVLEIKAKIQLHLDGYIVFKHNLGSTFRPSDGSIGIFHWHHPSGRTLALGLTQPVTEMSTRNIFWG